MKVDKNDPVILSKTVCQSCYKDNGLAWGIMEDLLWNVGSSNHIGVGIVMCVKVDGPRKHIPINVDVPSDCPYFTEHAIAQGDRHKQKGDHAKVPKKAGRG